MMNTKKNIFIFILFLKVVPLMDCIQASQNVCMMKKNENNQFIKV